MTDDIPVRLLKTRAEQCPWAASHEEHPWGEDDELSCRGSNAMKTAPVTNWETTTMSGKTAPRSIPHPLAVRDRSGGEVHRYDAGTCTEEPDGSLTVVKAGQPVALWAPGTWMFVQHEPARVLGQTEHIAELSARLRQSQAKQAADRDAATDAMRQVEILATALRRIAGCPWAAGESERIGRQALREAGL
jgi:hypothetical protein